MKIGICQIDCQWENRLRTKARIAHILDNWDDWADCFIFPEMALSGFSMKNEATCLDKSDHEYFGEIASKRNALVLYGGVENGFNCIFSIDARGVKKTEYRKRHLFSYGGENQYYMPGTESAILSILGMKYSLAICYDLRFPYHFWNNAQQCDGFIVIASWPEVRRDHWLSLLKARAIENQSYFIGVNRIGKDPTSTFSGDSVVFGPSGETYLECGSSEGIFCCDVNKERCTEIRATYNFIKDRKQ